MNCPFCDKEVIEKQGIFETEGEHIIHNIAPASKGHCMVVPKRHVTNIRELSSEEVQSLLKTVQLVSKIWSEKFNPLAFNYGFNEGNVAGQTVDHMHFHIIPRYGKGDLPEYHLFHREQHKKKNLSNEEMASFVEKYREFFKENH